MRWRIGLTTRLALVGIASALVPFLVGGIALALLPDDVTARSADQELQQTLALASARAREHQSDLAFALARVDDRQLDAFVDRGDSHGVTTVVEEAWRRTHPDEPLIEVDFVPAGAQPSPVDPVTATLRVRPRAAAGTPWSIVVAQRGATRRILDGLVDGTDLAVALVEPVGRSTSIRGDGESARTWQVEARDGGGVRFATREPDRWRTQVYDEARGLWFVAAIDGSPIELLLRGRGQEFRFALLLLLTAGLLCAVATALVMNRLLGRIAVTAERMSSGDFDARLEVVGTDAGARVATSLNELASELQDRIGTLEGTVDRLDRTLATIDDGVCTWSPDDRLETWNAAAAELTGTSADQARAGAPIADALRTARAPGRRRILLPLADGESHAVVDLYVRRMQDGGTLQVFRDAAPALSLEQARANFLVTAAHELRTPLTSILGFASTLADEQLTLPEEDRALATHHVLAEARRLAAVVQSLFDTSLLVRDRIEVTLEPVDVLDAIEHVIGASDATMVELKGASRGVLVRADRTALERSLAAVLDNAVKYGAAPIELEVDDTALERVAIVVRDHGSGVPPDLLESIFEPFHRLDPEMRSDVGGAGMGLYNARRLLGAMDATIVARHAPVRGSARPCTEFVVTVQRWREPQ